MADTSASRRAALVTLAGMASLPLFSSQARAALGTSRIMAINPSGGLSVGLKSYPRTLALAPGEVILTFDDGPMPSTTARVLDVLKSEGAKATFFMIGRNAAANPGMARRVAAEGHTVAHHSMTHPWTFRQRSEEAGWADIEAGFRAVDEAAFGAYSGQPRVPFFRYPGFADTPALNARLAAREIGVFGCDMWASDWTLMSPEVQLSLMMRRLKSAGRGMLLFHDVIPQTVAMLPAFLRALSDYGYRVVHLTTGSGAAPIIEASSGWRSETERIIATRR
jgi:peptidoglycan-N-acetylglucosamine deacetylase